MAVAGGSEKLVGMLLDTNMNVNYSSRWYGTPLQRACRWGELSVVKLLLEHGADVNARSELWANSLLAVDTLYYEAGSIVKLLCEHGADPLTKGSDGVCAISKAAREYFYDERNFTVYIDVVLNSGIEKSIKVSALRSASAEAHNHPSRQKILQSRIANLTTENL